MIQTVRMAFKSIAANRMRAFLTMLGIIIGVVALVVLVSLVNSTTASVTDAVSGLGTSSISVTVSDDKGEPILMSTLTEWMGKRGVGKLAPLSSDSVTGRYDSESGSVTVYGTTPVYYDILGLSLEQGRFLKQTDVDCASYVCVINETAATELIGYTDCVGEQLSFDGIKFTVAGVLTDDDNSLTAAFGSGSMVAYVPFSTALRLSSSGSPEVTAFFGSAAAGSDVTRTAAVLTELLMARFDGDDDAFTLTDSNILEDTMGSITSLLSVLLGGIAGISLLVGGIGIMNIMLVTVTERTREIGIRKAIGAGRGVILRQFLIEAVVLCMLGCALGIFLSWCILQVAAVVTASMDMSFRLQGTVVLIAVGFCFLIGICFGLYPANKAARMKPIDALHYGG